MAKLFANSGDPDQMPHSKASELGLQCLLITLSGVSRLQCVNRRYDVQNTVSLLCNLPVVVSNEGSCQLYFMF